MKWTLLISLFLLFSCTHLGRMPADDKSQGIRHIVFDIDWTIVTEVKNGKKVSAQNAKRVIEVQGLHYFVNEGLETFVAEILSHPDMRISFYSGGKAIRNNELLTKIKLRDGRSLKEIAYKVLSNEDLAHVEGALESAPFAEKNKKDLTKISKDLSQLIMLDDTANFVLETNEMQTNHVFFIGKAFEYFENFEEARGLSGEYVPKSYEEWLLNQKKLVVLNAAFREAYQESLDNKMSFSEAMKRKEELLNLKDHSWNEYSKKYFQYMSGKAPFQVKFPAESLDCHKGMKLLMGL